jgi:TonB family protein
MSVALEIVLKTSLIVAAALGACRLLRGSPAALRHWILAAALTGAALLPLLRIALPAWELRVGAPIVVYAPAVTAVATSTRGATASTASPALRANVEPVGGSARGLAVADVLVPIWLAGAAAGLLLLGAGLARLRWLAARARRIEAGPWRVICDELAPASGIRRRVTLLQSDRPALLVTWGFRTPKILLPTGAATWASDRIRIVLAHELAHARRRDWAAQLSAELLRAIYWFNPLFWAASRHLRRDSELACDDAVLGEGVEPSEYASQLVALARELRPGRRTWVPAPAIVGPSHFERRIIAMLNTGLNRRAPSGWRRIAAAAAIAMLTGAVAVAQNAYARVSGVITDQSGAVLPAATFTLTHLPSGTKHEIKTGGNGTYELVGLQSGEYTLEAYQAGFATYRETLTLSPGQLVSKNVLLQVGALQETITVVDTDAPPPERRTAPPASFQEQEKRRCDPGAGAVGGNIRAPRKLVDVRPKYPINLRASNAEGQVTLNATIGTDGTVKEVSVVSSPSVDMSESAVAAVRQWEFTPTLLNCNAIDVRMSVLVAFRPKTAAVTARPQD